MLIALLKQYLQPYRTLIVVVVVLQFFATLAALYLPSLNADIIDEGVAKADTGYILRVGVIMLAITLVQIVCSISAVRYGAMTAMSFGRDARAAVFGQVGRFSARELNQFGAPSLITRTTNDVQQVQMLVLLTATMMVAAPIMCVGGIVMALKQDLGLSWLIVVSVTVLVLAVAVIITRMVPQFRLMQRRIDAINRILREQITGIRVVRAFVREPHERARYGTANVELTDTALRVGRLMALMFPIVMMVLNVTSVAVLWFGAGRIADGQMQIGSLTAFLAYLLQILMSIMMATFMLVMVPRAAVSAERLTEVLATESSVAAPADPVTEIAGTGSVELQQVAFSYPGAADPVLRDISFRAGPGRTTAIVGSTGAGKTTLLSLIPRLFDATEGRVTIDGVDVRDLAPDVLHRQLGLVPQRAYLFSGTIESNLRYGKADATDDEMWEALRVAQAKDFVAALPDGLASPVAQGGTNFSGGQRQRLAIARAVVRRPAIYLFDDSFSALDLTTDARLRAALRPITTDSTVVVVAQRVSTIREADQILVLEDGALVGAGRHDDLLESCPTYAEIVASQLPAEVAA
ncbi:MAG TPA: ABC transporter ATP-binding protein [Candidatus Nanopelagicales bacterium]|nr:ABC transporter ATP-binding protein [Candidatus Nanopelagicales bacterium]